MVEQLVRVVFHANLKGAEKIVSVISRVDFRYSRELCRYSLDCAMQKQRVVFQHVGRLEVLDR